MFHRTAHIYDLIYAAAGKDYARESRDIHELIQRRFPHARTLLDVACGTGGHLVHLQRDYDVSGIDAAPAMLDEARTRLPGVPLAEADMRSFRLDRHFDAVTCLFSSIGYMATVDELDAAVANMARHLNPGGVLIIDGWVLPDEWKGTVGTDIDTAVTETVKVARVVYTSREDRTTRLEMHHLVAHDSGIDYLVDHHQLTLFSREEYQTALERAGLRVDTTDSPMPGRDRYIGQQAMPTQQPNGSPIHARQ
jgi:SAM-dependent methyltransferase